MSILQCRNLSKKYGATEALRGIDLELEAGRIVGLLGPNGSGKTTFIKLANGLLKPTEGEILIDGNHPGKDLTTGRVYISSQNHGYVVDMDKLDPKVAAPAFVNVNDGTNEGLEYTGKNIFTVQFHPEACPGPQDSGFLFDRFITMMNGGRK